MQIQCDVQELQSSLDFMIKLTSVDDYRTVADLRKHYEGIFLAEEREKMDLVIQNRKVSPKNTVNEDTRKFVLDADSDMELFSAETSESLVEVSVGGSDILPSRDFLSKVSVNKNSQVAVTYVKSVSDLSNEDEENVFWKKFNGSISDDCSTVPPTDEEEYVNEGFVEDLWGSVEDDIFNDALDNTSLEQGVNAGDVTSICYKNSNTYSSSGTYVEDLVCEVNSPNIEGFVESSLARQENVIEGVKDSEDLVGNVLDDFLDSILSEEACAEDVVEEIYSPHGTYIDLDEQVSIEGSKIQELGSRDNKGAFTELDVSAKGSKIKKTSFSANLGGNEFNHFFSEEDCTDLDEQTVQVERKKGLLESRREILEPKKVENRTSGGVNQNFEEPTSVGLDLERDSIRTSGLDEQKTESDSNLSLDSDVGGVSFSGLSNQKTENQSIFPLEEDNVMFSFPKTNKQKIKNHATSSLDINDGSISYSGLYEQKIEKQPNFPLEDDVDRVSSSDVEKQKLENNTENTSSEVVEVINVPKDLRAFLREHPCADYNYVCQYYSVKEIESQIRLGKVYKRKGKLMI